MSRKGIDILFTPPVHRFLDHTTGRTIHGVDLQCRSDKSCSKNGKGPMFLPILSVQTSNQEEGSAHSYLIREVVPVHAQTPFALRGCHSLHKLPPGGPGCSGGKTTTIDQFISDDWAVHISEITATGQ